MVMARLVSVLRSTLFFLIITLAAAENLESREALVQFMTSLFPRRNLKGWSTDSDPCLWEGVICDQTSSVRTIVLEQYNFTGTLDADSLCAVGSLSVLSLVRNSITGRLPEEISKCSNLTHLYLGGNSFIGSLPASLSELSKLKRVDLSDNRFSGWLPDLSAASALVSLRAENNRFIGSIPSLDFIHLEDFNVSNNHLSGPIPAGAWRFDNSCFAGNPGLCGLPLSTLCTTPTPTSYNGNPGLCGLPLAPCPAPVPAPVPAELL